MMSIVTRIKRAQDKISKGFAELKAVQDECSHPDLEGVYGSNTGNWCSADDSYWIDLKCPTCGKTWSVDGDDEKYRLYSIGRAPYTCKIVRK
jgi:hypothetical protein